MRMSAACALEQGVRLCCVEFWSPRQPPPCCWSPSLPMMPTPAVAAVRALAVSTAALFEREVTAAARLRFAGLAAELSPFAADATAIGAGTHIATASAQRQWVQRQWVRLRRAPIIAAAA